MSTYRSMKVASDAKQGEEKRQQERKKAVLVLILRHLCDNGYVDSAERLQTEAHVSLQNVDAADNIDMLNIVQEWEDFYELRFQRKPKLTRKVGGGEGTKASLPNIARQGSKKRFGAANNADDNGHDDASSGTSGSHSARNPSPARPPTHPSRTGSAGKLNGAGRPDRGEGGKGDGDKGMGGLSIQSSKVVVEEGSRHDAEQKFRKRSESKGGDADDPAAFWERRLIKPLPDFGGNSELRELGAQIQRDVLSASPDVRWEDVASNDDAKRLLKEAVVMPIKYPSLFQGLLSPWKGVLLYGPPGTGKTMLAKAVATECKTTFFNISASSIVSKWRGDSEKLIRVLFELARYHAPSTIFLDEIDSIMGQRQSSGQEHDGSRRMKTELLIQMDGLLSNTEQVFLLCASNLPWDLDSAMLRRLEKRIFVPLPGPEARKAILQKHLTPDRAPGVDAAHLADKMEGFSGSDVVLFCKEAAMRPLRRIMRELESGELKEERIKLGPVTPEDTEAALKVTKPAQRVNDQKYITWTSEYSSV